MGIKFQIKRVRLDGGGFITRKLPYSDQQDIAQAKPEEIWEMTDGRKLLVAHMETSHIVNAMKWIYSAQYSTLRSTGLKGFNSEEPAKNKNQKTRALVKAMCIEMRPVYKTMLDELERRTNPKKGGNHNDNKRIPSRKFDFT